MVVNWKLNMDCGLNNNAVSVLNFLSLILCCDLEKTSLYVEIDWLIERKNEKVVNLRKESIGIPCTTPAVFKYEMLSKRKWSSSHKLPEVTWENDSLFTWPRKPQK